ncbi:Uma2 family endonuclease [Parafilimonas sp.]|uniref:Uma2 family endonuclease n=1 Tax=Parafilimonas sp. TaxID=1969739 RepID=UPI0039E44B02
MFTIMDDEGEINMVEEPSPDYTYTYADYLKWKFEERLELFKGRIYKLAATNTRHQVISMKLQLRIGTFLEKHRCFFFVAPFDVRLPVKNRKKDNEITTVVQPDLGIVCDLSKIDERGCCGAPDLVVEILSPGNSQKEVQLKFELYEEAGVHEYWIINPVEENIVVFILNEGGKLGGGKMYAGKAISPHCIPALEIEVRDIFKN